ncbi:MAG: arginine--tRNA ligase [Elusimicrobia bacterium]|nr:arginine--tRNA ligase [Elusimicrobiota bacterium]
MILAELRESLGARARDWAKAAGAPLPADLPITVPPPKMQADLCLPWPLAMAKAARKPPLELAESLARSLTGLIVLEDARPSPPGFVNLRLSNSALCANLKAVTLSPQDYGRDKGGPARQVLIEFVSANPTGPLHLASGRGATLGDCLVRILRRLGRQASSEYYVNDAGNQVERLGLSLHARRHGQEPPEKGYQGQYVTDLARSFPAEADSWTPQRWQQEGIKALLATHREDMDSFGVSFDRWFRESELHVKDELKSTLRLLQDRGMVYEKEGAVWLGTSGAAESEDDKDRVLIKAGGTATYFLADIAYHEDKFSRGFAQCIDIWGADHHGYVPRMKAAIAALGHPPESFQVIIHQLIHLFRGQEAVKMSKRTGEFVRLREVVEEVGRDACRFFFALRTPDSHLNFDLELAKKQSSENPVYYCQYVHARICSIFREAEKQGLFGPDLPLPGPNGSFLTSPEERALLLKIAWFPEVLKDCEKLLSPHPLANYILELAGLYHPFYEKCRVVDPQQPQVSRARLLLCAGVRDVIAQGLGLLGVSAPEQM